MSVGVPQRRDESDDHRWRGCNSIGCRRALSIIALTRTRTLAGWAAIGAVPALLLAAAVHAATTRVHLDADSVQGTFFGAIAAVQGLLALWLLLRPGRRGGDGGRGRRGPAGCARGRLKPARRPVRSALAVLFLAEAVAAVDHHLDIAATGHLHASSPASMRTWVPLKMVLSNARRRSLQKSGACSLTVTIPPLPLAV